MRKVTQIFRKRNPLFFSIEKVFSLIGPGLQKSVQLERIELPHYTTGILPIVKNLLYLVTRKKSDVLYHVTGDVHYAILVLPSSRAVLTIHDSGFLYNSKGFKRKILKWLLLDLPVKHAALVTTISEFSRQEILRFTGCPPDKIIVIPNPINDCISFEKNVFNQVKPAILFIGTTPNKNLERVAAALQDVSCRLCILGKLTTRQEQLLLQHGIDFYGVTNISEKQLNDLYVQTDIVLFPSTFEGFGLPILEAQKAGRPVITSNIDPMKTVAGGGAVLVNPYDVHDIKKGIETIINDTAVRTDCVAKGFLNIRRYNASTIADTYLQVYKKIENNI